jgi:hypothetical protein
MFLSMIIFDIICFGVYYDYMFRIVDLPLYSCMESYSPHLDHLLIWVNGKDRGAYIVFICDCTLYAGLCGRSWW